MHIDSNYLAIVLDILKRIIPEYEVRAFGSRVHGEQLKTFSDLDLVVMSEQRLPFKVMNELEEEFSEAMIPFRVDVLDWAGVSPEFRKIIDANYEVVQSGRKSEYNNL
jgi:type I restriction enzyme S subunit